MCVVGHFLRILPWSSDAMKQFLLGNPNPNLYLIWICVGGHLLTLDHGKMIPIFG